MKNVKILGTFATKNNDNNINTKITQGIQISGVENAKIYYSENENATTDLQNTENAWKKQLKMEQQLENI